MIETYDEGRGWVAFGSGIQRLSKVSGEFLKFSHNFKKNIDAFYLGCKATATRRACINMIMIIVIILVRATLQMTDA